jgi:mersacidin/lichenicidin family type 2 lantibiotic
VALSTDIIMRAWKDSSFRDTLPPDVQSAIPEQPTAADQSVLSDEELEAAAGGTPGYLALVGAGRWHTAAGSERPRAAPVRSAAGGRATSRPLVSYGAVFIAATGLMVASHAVGWAAQTRYVVGAALLVLLIPPLLAWQDGLITRQQKTACDGI